MSLLPSLFVSHGAPTLALVPGKTGRALEQLGRILPKPGAILVISAHWGTRDPCVSIADFPETLHDFRGFPSELYTLRYPAPGAPSVAHHVLELLHQAGWREGYALDRGLDHGAWVPLRYLFPRADIPVLQLSVQYDRTPSYHYRLGQTLRPLRERGILILGSGSLTHNLSEVVPGDVPPASYVDEFRQWIVGRLRKSAVDDLQHYRTLAPHAERAHPDEDHLLPLFVTLGAMNGESDFVHIDNGTNDRVLAMDAFVFGKSDVSSHIASDFHVMAV